MTNGISLALLIRKSSASFLFNPYLPQWEFSPLGLSSRRVVSLGQYTEPELKNK
jgi:hypothetical protein